MAAADYTIALDNEKALQSMAATDCIPDHLCHDALLLRADDIESGRNEAACPEPMRAAVAAHLREVAAKDYCDESEPTVTALTIGRRHFSVEPFTYPSGQTGYRLLGRRGAVYSTMRNKLTPDLLFLVKAQGFGIPAGFENVWLSDKDGKLRVVRGP